MVGKILIGRSFGNLCHYALNEEKDAKVLASHGVRSWSAGEMAADFEAQQRLRPGLHTAVLHVALAWPAEEQARMTDELMGKLAIAYLGKMEIDVTATQWAVVRHHDQEHPHCHLLVNRVTNDGKVLKDFNSFQQSKAACRDLEKEHLLLNAAQIGIATQLKQAQRGLLTPYEAAHAYIHEAVSRQLPTATTVPNLTTMLAMEGITLHSTYHENKLQRVVFERAGEYVKGSAISRELGGKKLGETLETQRGRALESEVTLTQEAKQADPAKPAAVTEPVAAELDQPVAGSATTAPTLVQELPTPTETPLWRQQLFGSLQQQREWDQQLANWEGQQEQEEFWEKGWDRYLNLREETTKKVETAARLSYSTEPEFDALVRAQGLFQLPPGRGQPAELVHQASGERFNAEEILLDGQPYLKQVRQVCRTRQYQQAQAVHEAEKLRRAIWQDPASIRATIVGQTSVVQRLKADLAQVSGMELNEQHYEGSSNTILHLAYRLTPATITVVDDLLTKAEKVPGMYNIDLTPLDKRRLQDGAVTEWLARHERAHGPVKTGQRISRSKGQSLGFSRGPGAIRESCGRLASAS
jgi:hypothetical protein